MEGPSINWSLKQSLWFCDCDGCKQPAVQRAGNCPLCNKHLCQTHAQDEWHKCPKPEENWTMYASQYVAAETRQIDELCRRIDSAKLCARASLCRGGIPCTANLSAKNLPVMMGGQNCHAEITFDDNVKWLARFRLSNISSPPIECRDYILRSEAATMDFLQKHTRIPSPKVFDWACESDPSNPLGRVGYILMEKMEGKPLDWQGATPPQREKVMQQLVDIFLEIEKHPFDMMGSIVTANDPTRHEIQGIAHHEVYCLGITGPLDPFHSSLEGAGALIKLYLAMIASGEIEANHPIDVFLMHRFRLDLLNDIGEDAPSGGPFFLKHPDDKGDHILVNEDFDIVGMIDWEWCQTFYDGSNELAEEELRLAMIFRERGRDDLAKHIVEGRKVQRFFFALGAGSGSHNDRATMIDLFMGLKRAFDSGEEESEEWRAKALVRWKDDELLQVLLQRYT
ncbi:hypothetical protein F4813DRAFT_397310 [Daldinia decipiens]|uniref:uncharacterized protein n=1 Tax=Daldinia decipiens TaxID=326647 RepID=UPI0020C30B42|nr:uncharacterized protein F4813DRAFT_397310 [Daldinia decipiens]KAI1656725.1 hypothetical protein F4813DRAFT_397310 [Daldinia decipiens]